MFSRLKIICEKIFFILWNFLNKRKKMNNKFSIEFCSDSDYEEMVAYIGYENQTIAIIIQDNDKENMEIKMLISEQEFSLSKIPPFDFAEVIQFAKKSLLEFHKTRESVFTIVSEDIDSINAQAQREVEDILTAPNNQCIQDGTRGFRIYAPDGRGIYYLHDGTFIGFIEKIF